MQGMDLIGRKVDHRVLENLNLWVADVILVRVLLKSVNEVQLLMPVDVILD
jgi:hypothetical protein